MTRLDSPPCRAGQSWGAGEEADLPHHHQGFPTILCGGVANPTGDQPNGAGGRDPLQSERPVGSGFLPRGGVNQEDQSGTAGETPDARNYVKKTKKTKLVDAPLGATGPRRHGEEDPGQPRDLQPHRYRGAQKKEVPQAHHHDDPGPASLRGGAYQRL